MRPLLRRFSTTARHSSLQLSLGDSGPSLTALIPTFAAPELPKVLCLPSILGYAAHDFHLQFASPRLSRNFALYGIELRVPEHDFGQLLIERDANEVVRAADALKIEQFSLLGCGHGANVSAAVAATHPERVTRLLMVNGNAFVSDEDVEDTKEQEDIKLWPQEMREKAEAKFGTKKLQRKWTEMVEALRQEGRKDGSDLICSHLPHIKCKTLVVSGGRNMFVPLYHSEYLSERILHSRLKVLVEGGDDLLTSEADRFNTMLETFLLEPDDKLTQSREYVAVPF